MPNALASALLAFPIRSFELLLFNSLAVVLAAAPFPAALRRIVDESTYINPEVVTEWPLARPVLVVLRGWLLRMAHCIAWGVVRGSAAVDETNA